jgi:hypothetical protein
MVERYTDQQLLDAGFNPALLPIIRRESGGKSVGWEGLPGSRDYAPGGTDLSGYPLKSTGFPAWPGKAGPEGNSTAAGVAQVVGSTWDPIASKLGVTDFSLESQAKVANELYRQSGTSPWRASEPGDRSGRSISGAAPGEQTDGGLYIGRVGLGRDDLSTGGALLLSNLLKNAYPEEAQSATGNPLLDGLIKASWPGNESATPPPQATAQQPLPQVAPPPLPTTVPGLQPGPLPQMAPPQPLPSAPPIAPPAPMPQPAPQAPPMAPPPAPMPSVTPMPGQPSVPAQPMQQAAMPPPMAPPPPQQPSAPPQPMQLAGDVLGFGGESGDQMATRPGLSPETWLKLRGLDPANFGYDFPARVPVMRMKRTYPQFPANEASNASTGNSLLNNLLKQISPIGTAQAAEGPPQAAPGPAAPPPTAATGNKLLDGLLKWIGQGEAGEQEQQSAVAAQATRPIDPFSAVGETAAQLGDIFIKRPLEAGVRGISGQDAPGTPEAIEGAMGAAALAMPGSIGRGGLGAGPRFPRREPPPIREGGAGPAPAGTAPPGTVRLYRGIGGGSAGTGSAEGGWFTTDPAKAALYGKVHSVDVTRDELKHFAQGHGGPDEFVTDNKGIIGRSQPVAGTAPPAAAGAAPPVNEGSVRFYYGSHTDPTSGGDRFATPYLDRARNYRAYGETNPVYYVDVKKGDPWEVKQRQWDEIDEQAGTNMVGRYHEGVLPERLAKQFRPLEATGSAPRGQIIGGPRPPEPPPEPAKLDPPPGTPYQPLDDDLFRAQQTSEAERLEAQKIAEQLRDHGITPADLEEAYHIRESRMTKRPLPETEKSRLIERVLAPLDNKILQDAQWIYEHAPDIYGSMREAPLRTAQEGHVHRKVVGKNIPGEHLDPSEGDILTRTFLGRGSLSRRASGLMRREPVYLWEDNAGNTLGQWGRLGEKGGAARYGETRTINGTRYTARQPTTREITGRNPGGRQYIEDLGANTIDNALRLGRVRRNIEILQKWRPILTEGGWFIPEGSHTPIPRGYKDILVPQLRGKADPMVADIINDVFNAGGDWPEILDKINRIGVGSMFWLPIRHQLNVAAHYAIGRGFDWLYRNPNLLRATTAVQTLGPDYIRYLKAGAGLRYASPLNENFYNTLLTKLGHDIVKDPGWTGVAKALGFNSAQKLAESIYGWSRRELWKVNDVFLTARIMELERAGKPLQEAIRIAEQEIPNYRLPTNNLALRKLINSPLVAFGRYGYGRANALARTAINLVGTKATGEERLRALGQAVGLIVIGTGGYTLANHALQTAQKQVGGMLPEKWRKRLLGDKPLEFAETGPFGVTREAARYGMSFLPKGVAKTKIPGTSETLGSVIGLEPEAESFSRVLASLVTPSPFVEQALPYFTGGRNLFTGQQILDPQKHLPAESVQFMEQMARLVNPVAAALDAARKGLVPAIGPQFGVKQEYKVPPKIEKMQRRGAAKSTAKDPIQWRADKLFGY